MHNKRIVLTTPDYPPKLGGLSSFSRNLVFLLEKMGAKVDVRQWDSVNELIGNTPPEADLYIHIHFMGGLFGSYPTEKSINFCHGSELLFTSPNFIKKIIKVLGKARAIRYFEDSKNNVFISQFTLDKLIVKGLNVNYGRDLVLHNSIVSKPIESFVNKTFPSEQPLKICSVARDVPHKNLEGVFNLTCRMAKILGLDIELSLTSNRFKSTGNVKVIPILSKSDSEISEVYKESHLNFLLSRDDSKRGFFEGFGLTVLEAGAFGTPSVVSNTGGLPENVHHQFNGHVLKDTSDEAVVELCESLKVNYESWSGNAYEHTIQSHSMNVYQRFFERILGVQVE